MVADEFDEVRLHAAQGVETLRMDGIRRIPDICGGRQS